MSRYCERSAVFTRGREHSTIFHAHIRYTLSGSMRYMNVFVMNLVMHSIWLPFLCSRQPNHTKCQTICHSVVCFGQCKSFITMMTPHPATILSSLPFVAATQLLYEASLILYEKSSLHPRCI